MRLPKRVPWSNILELEQICSWIFASEGDSSAKILAVNRLGAWKASTSLPHALESTLSLLMVILQDEEHLNSSVRHSSTLALRQSYSLAIIRLVNGLVDPLQQGAYARPIASIAVQIGLPLWLVELRHASTHEDLPSLELLREGAKDAMAWLLHNYFLPTLSPVNTLSPAQTNLQPLDPMLFQYKNLLKSTTRDASLKSQSKPELIKILRGFDLWVSEARVAASTVGFHTETLSEEEDEKERWALERFCDALVGRGGLVSVSKRKRPSPLQGLTVPTPNNVTIWSPLILHLYSHFPAFPSILLSRILKQILPPSKFTNESLAANSTVEEKSAIDPTFDHTLATWALWIVDRWSNDPRAECDVREVMKELLLGLGRGGDSNKAAKTLLNVLIEGNPRMRERIKLLAMTIQPSSRTSAWDEDTLETMSQRLSAVRPAKDVSFVERSADDIEMAMSPSEKTEDNIKGWKLVDSSRGWKLCPIGVFIQTYS